MFPKVLHITMCACSDVLETNVNKCFHLAHQLHYTRQHLFTWECTLHATCSHLFAFVSLSIFLICAIFGILCAWIVPARQVMHNACHKNTSLPSNTLAELMNNINIDHAN